MKIQIVTNPATNIFRDLVRSSGEQFFASPFVKNNLAQMIIDNKPADARISLLTSYKLTNFYRRSSDLAALGLFLKSSINVRNYPNLHAKTYIFDSDRALVTSANLTLGGFRNNYECGVLIFDRRIVRQLKTDFLHLYDDKEKVSTVTEEILATTETILAKVPKEKKVAFEKSERDLFPTPAYEPQDDLYDGGVDTIVGTLTGWRLDVFNAVAKIPLNIFKLDNVYAFKKQLQGLHPENRNIEAKIRQQLQELRDLGIIEFTGKGVYRKLWKGI